MICLIKYCYEHERLKKGESKWWREVRSGFGNTKYFQGENKSLSSMCVMRNKIHMC